MAKKKEPSIDDALNIFKDVMQRALLSNYVYVNSILVSKNSKGKSILIAPEKELWLKILEDEDLKKSMKELDYGDPNDQEALPFFLYLNELKDLSWTELNSEEMFNGTTIKIKISEDFGYEHPINKTMLPIKLKKSEFKDIEYCVFKSNSSNNIILALRKRFEFPAIPEAGFSIIKFFKVI